MFAVPTLESASFDLDIELGNFYKDTFRNKKGVEERKVSLKTMDLGFDIRKQSTLLITPLRELQLNLKPQHKYDLARPRPRSEQEHF